VKQATNTRRKIGILLNPNANSGKCLAKWKKFLDTDISRELMLESSEIFQNFGDETNARQFECWFETAVESGISHFIAAGGDGTVHQLLNMISDLPSDIKKSIKMGAIALGSSNDFHKGGNSCEDGGIKYRLNFEDSFPHDLGRVTLSDSTTRMFIINASAGITARANSSFNQRNWLNEKVKALSTSSGIILAAGNSLLNHQNINSEITIDGKTRLSSISNLAVIKKQYFAGNMRYDCDTKPDCGSFGMHLCESMNRREIASTMFSLSKGKFFGRPKTTSKKIQQIKIEADCQFPLELDGEIYHTSSAHFEIKPKEIMLCP